MRVNLPLGVEEFLIKPIIWLLPIVFILVKENKRADSLYFSGKGLFPSTFLAIALGVGFAIEGLVVNFFKYKELSFVFMDGGRSFYWVFIISIATAFTEEISFRGYIFSRLWKKYGNELKANLISSFIWVLVHLPIAIFFWKLNFISLVIFSILLAMFGIGSAFLVGRTKNIFSSILLHVFWGWPIVLFR